MVKSTHLERFAISLERFEMREPLRSRNAPTQGGAWRRSRRKKEGARSATDRKGGGTERPRQPLSRSPGHRDGARPKGAGESAEGTRDPQRFEERGGGPATGKGRASSPAPLRAQAHSAQGNESRRRGVGAPTHATPRACPHSHGQRDPCAISAHKVTILAAGTRLGGLSKGASGKAQERSDEPPKRPRAPEPHFRGGWSGVSFGGGSIVI